MCLTETWLVDNKPDSLVNSDGFTLIRSDRLPALSGEKGGGGDVCK